MISKDRRLEQEEYRDRLRRALPPGSTVTTVLRHVSQSGLTRDIVPLAVVDGEIANLSFWIEKAGIGKRSKGSDAIRIGGVGMDMGFALVYDIAMTLYPDGFECIGQYCRSNDHANGDRDYTPHQHSSGGYAISQRWA